MKHICHQDTYDKLEWFSNKATWDHMTKSYQELPNIDLSDRLIALTCLKNPWNRWTASSTCHNHDNADVQFKQCKNYKINIQFILLQLKILTSVIIHVCNLKFKHMMCYGPSEPEFFKPIFQCWYIGKMYWKNQKRKLSFGSTPNAHA